MSNSLSILVHAAAKVGKSTLSSTAPPPILVLDAEGSWKFIKTAGFQTAKPLRKIEWDPRVAPPRHDGTWDVCHVAINKWTDLTMVYSWLTQAQHDFVSLVIDSISEAQRKLKENLVGTEQMKIQDWGSLLTHMDKLIRNFRDLPSMPNTTLRCVVFIAETRQENTKWRPYMQGQISISLPYWVDICSYLYPDQEAATDENGQSTTRVQRLLIAPREGFETGERVQGRLPDIITNPNIADMLTAVYANGHNQEETVHAD
jgi:hypothetical protein